MHKVGTRFVLVWAAALLAGVVGMVPAAGAGTAVSCGEAVTASVTLTSDLGPCAGDGLVVIANNVTVDLAGHTIAGLGHDLAQASDLAGIRLINVSGVTVRGGTVRDFSAGILVSGGSANTITRMTATHNIGFGSATKGEGIDLEVTQGNEIIQNIVSGNGPFAGIKLENNASHNHVAYNQVVDNNVLTTEGPDAPSQQDDGIGNDTGAGFNMIDHNVAARNGEFGISLAGFGANHDTAIANDVRDNGSFGINAGGDGGHLVSDNVIDHNLSGGGVVACGTCFGPGDLTTIQRNVITRNNGPGVSMLFNGNQFLGGAGDFGTFPGQPYAAPRSNLVQQNVVQGNAGDGIFVECEELFDASFNATCLANPPPHQGLRILNNRTGGNGGAGAATTAWDLHDQNAGCDGNVWSGNTFQTANPPCTTGP
jgi:hypothetical protein